MCHGLPCIQHTVHNDSLPCIPGNKHSRLNAFWVNAHAFRGALHSADRSHSSSEHSNAFATHSSALCVHAHMCCIYVSKCMSDAREFILHEYAYIMMEAVYANEGECIRMCVNTLKCVWMTFKCSIMIGAQVGLLPCVCTMAQNERKWSVSGMNYVGHAWECNIMQWAPWMQ